ncbi:unnamed protein product [Schistocephalus solidus]|uniref:Secreted protein n=2 Tax=Schistocephalus solidus TaxID=70667 RepID=A0A183TAA1_SCHSO|nr:unnamed protein product [Schistocephalus solidus]
MRPTAFFVVQYSNQNHGYHRVFSSSRTVCLCTATANLARRIDIALCAALCTRDLSPLRNSINCCPHPHPADSPLTMKYLPLLGLVFTLLAVAAGYPSHEDLDIDKWRWKKFSSDYTGHGFGSSSSSSSSSSRSSGSHSHEVEKKTKQSGYGQHFHDWDRDHEVEKEEGGIVLFDRKANKESRKSSGRGYLPKSRGRKSSAKKSLITKTSMSYPSGPFGMYEGQDFGDYGFRDGYDHRRRHDKYLRFGSGFHDLPHEASRRAHRRRMEFDFDYDDFDRDYDYYYDPFFGDSQYPDYDFDDFYYPTNRFHYDHWADYDLPYDDEYYPYYEPEQHFGDMYGDYDFPEYEVDRHYGRFANHYDFGHPFRRMHY